MMNDIIKEPDPKKEWAIAGVIAIVLIAIAGYGLYQGGKALAAGIAYAEARRATAECEKWQDWERIYPEWDERRQVGYYITTWQKAQCDSVGVELTAHVLDYKTQK